MNFEDIKVGDKLDFEKTIKQKDLDLYQELTGDNNPIHYDEEFAKNTIFKKPIAPGIITASSFLGLLAKYYPGAIVTKFEVSFLKPVYVDETVKGTVEIISKDKNSMMGQLTINIFNENEVKVLESNLACFFGAKK